MCLLPPPQAPLPLPPSLLVTHHVQDTAVEVTVNAEEVKDKVKGKLNKNACGCTCEETAEETEEAVPAEDVAVEETAE